MAQIGRTFVVCAATRFVRTNEWAVYVPLYVRLLVLTTVDVVQQITTPRQTLVSRG